jgi:hypothetical protein
MEMFYLITLSVAIVALIITLTLAGIALQYDSKQQKFPPSHDECPTDWTVDQATGKCRDSTGEYTTPATADWRNSDLESKGSRGDHDVREVDICVKKAWANTNKVYWDGITTYNGC